MKITNHEAIKNGEQELIDGITADLDWGALEKIFIEQHGLELGEDVDYKRGDIVVHDNQIAYKLEFEVKIPLSILLDREGNYVSVTCANDSAINEDEGQNELQEHSEAQEKKDIKEPVLQPDDKSMEKISDMASSAGEIISEIG